MIKAILFAVVFGVTTVSAQPAPAPAPPLTGAPSSAGAPSPTGAPAPAPAPSPTGAPAPAPAPAPVPPLNEEEKRAQAKALYEKGLVHYNVGEFDAAIAAFRSAYAISSAPGLLFNIAQSYRLKKDYEQATYFYTTYLRLKPDAPNRADVEDRLQEMEKLIQDQKQIEHSPPSGTVTPDGNGGSGVAKAPALTVNVVDSRGTGSSDGGTSGQSLVTAGLATAGAGTALLITGIVFGRMARSAEDELNQLNANMGTWGPAEQDKYDAGKRNNAIAVIAYIAGGAAVATGGALYVLGTLKKRSATVAVSPSKRGTTVAVGWSF